MTSKVVTVPAAWVRAHRAQPAFHLAPTEISLTSTGFRSCFLDVEILLPIHTRRCQSAARTLKVRKIATCLPW